MSTPAARQAARTDTRTIKYTIEIEDPEGHREKIRGYQFTVLKNGAQLEPRHACQSGELTLGGQEKFYGRTGLLVHAFDVITAKAGRVGWRPVALTIDPNSRHGIAAAVTVEVKGKAPGYLIFALEDALYTAGVTVHLDGKMAELYATS
jgi:hypothetical protein